MNFVTGSLTGFGAHARAAGGSVTSLSKVAEATSTESATIDVPASAQVGDLLVLLQRGREGSTPGPTDVTPAGWTDSGAYGTGGGRGVSMKFKITEGGDPGSTITGMDAAVTDNKVMLVFRGNNAITTATAHSAAAQDTNANPAQQVVSSSSGTAPLVVLAGYGTNSGSITKTFSPAQDGEVTTSATDVYDVRWKIYNSSPADVTVDMDDPGSANTLHSCYIQVS